MRHVLYFHGFATLLADGHVLHSSSGADLISKMESLEPVKVLSKKLSALSLNGLRNLHSYDHVEAERLLGRVADEGRGNGVGQAMACTSCVDWLSQEAPYFS